MEKDERKREFILFKNEQMKNQKSLLTQISNEQLKEAKKLSVAIQKNVGNVEQTKAPKEEEKSQIQEIKEFTDRQNKALLHQIREEMKHNNKYIESLIIK